MIDWVFSVDSNVFCFESLNINRAALGTMEEIKIYNTQTGSLVHNFKILNKEKPILIEKIKGANEFILLKTDNRIYVIDLA